ncbi:MAG: radical SAM protein, partial [Sphaerochaeta sp.]|nr:radical SAM protein [Sphaerochaeta sp.]
SQLELFDLGQVHETDHASLTREHRLYQADWLLRKYGFSYEEMIFTEEGNLSLTKDPKLVWAQANPQFFPLSVKRAPREALLRVPGLGPTYVLRIVNQRRLSPLTCLEDLKLPFSVLEKARPFLTI